MTAILLLALAGVPEPENNTKAELARFQGIWKATAVESRGQPAPLDRRRPGALREPYTLAVVGDSYALGTHAGTLKLDPAKGHVDLVVTEGRYKGTTLAGLYELKDGTLRLAVPSLTNPSGRPADFKSAGQGAGAAYTFAREE